MALLRDDDVVALELEPVQVRVPDEAADQVDRGLLVVRGACDTTERRERDGDGESCDGEDSPERKSVNHCLPPVVRTTHWTRSAAPIFREVKSPAFAGLSRR